MLCISVHYISLEIESCGSKLHISSIFCKYRHRLNATRDASLIPKIVMLRFRHTIETKLSLHVTPGGARISRTAADDFQAARQRRRHSGRAPDRFPEFSFRASQGDVGSAAASLPQPEP
jgi:hypothetical protein